MSAAYWSSCLSYFAIYFGFYGRDAGAFARAGAFAGIGAGTAVAAGAGTAY